MSKTYYLCDRKRCKNCIEDCFHTSDPNHAENGPIIDPGYNRRFIKVESSGDYWELYANSHVVEVECGN